MTDREDYRKNSLTVPMKKELKDRIKAEADKYSLTMAGMCKVIFAAYFNGEVNIEKEI